MQWYLNNYPLGNPQINYLVKSSKTSVGNFQKCTDVWRLLPKLWLRFVIFQLPAQFRGQFRDQFLGQFYGQFCNSMVKFGDILGGKIGGNSLILWYPKMTNKKTLLIGFFKISDPWKVYTKENTLWFIRAVKSDIRTRWLEDPDHSIILLSQMT